MSISCIKRKLNQYRQKNGKERKMKIDIIEACTDMGLVMTGAKEGPQALIEELKEVKDKIHKISIVNAEDEKKETGNGKLKNLGSVNRFNEKLYQEVLSSVTNGHLPITIGGDHSLAVATALASIKQHEKMGIIWVDAHTDFNTSQTTVTGNIHGLPLAVITRFLEDDEILSKFHTGNYYLPQNTVVVGARSVDFPGEVYNVEAANIYNLDKNHIKNRAIEQVMAEAFQYASDGTNGVHISLDLDVIDPKAAPGVSVPEKDGMSVQDFEKVVEMVVKNKEIIKSIDLVEYNPLRDLDKKTLMIAKQALVRLINAFSES